jgi:DNA-binding LytR/AlgR family response regulator
MNTKKIVVVEDDQVFQNKIDTMLEDSEFKIMERFDDAISAEEYINSKPIDLLLSEVYLDKKPLGGYLIKKISKTGIPIVCMTSSVDDKIYKEIIEYVSGYLVKPFHKITLLSLLRKTIINYDKNKLFNPKHESFLMLSNKSGKSEKIFLTDIYHLESSGNYTIVFTQNAKYIKKISMRKFLEFELDDRFKRIQGKYIVNLQRLKSISPSSLTLTN